MIVRLTQIDGDLPNIALMRLAAWHRSQGDEVHWRHGVPLRRGSSRPPSSAARPRKAPKRADDRYDYSRQADEPARYDVVYASAIFDTSAGRVADFLVQWPSAVVGGSCRAANADLRVEDVVPTQFQELDYSGYPEFHASIGYAMRGCRYACRFCVVPRLEGKARSNSTVSRIWRGPGHPRRIALLDNDFFGNPEWRGVVDEIVDGGFEVCINQGVNVRALAGRPKAPGALGRLRRGEATAADHAAIAAAEALADEQCAALARMRPRAFNWRKPRLYTAWDNLGDEEVFFEGVARLVRHGFKPAWITTYMLVGYDPKETWERIMYRYGRMNDMGIRVYPMVFGGDERRPRPAEWERLKQFQAWVVTGARATSAFEDFNRSHKPRRDDGDQLALFDEAA
jgi:hypothetical protein